VAGNLAPLLFADELHGGALALHVIDRPEGHDAGRQGVGGTQGAGNDVLDFQAVSQQMVVAQMRTRIRADKALVLQDAGFADQAAGNGDPFLRVGNRFFQVFDNGPEIAQFFIQFMRDFFRVQPGEFLQFANDFDDGCGNAFFVAAGKLLHHVSQEAFENQEPMPDQVVIGLLNKRFP